MLNKVYLIGNIGQDPDVRSRQAGKEVALLSVATNSYQKDDQGNWKCHTAWHRVVVFQDFYVSWLKANVRKGDSLFIEGTLSYSEWLDKSKLHKRKVAHIVVHGPGGRLHLLKRKQDCLTKDSSVKDTLQENARNKIPESILENIPESSEEPSSSLFDFHKTENLNEKSIKDISHCLDEGSFEKNLSEEIPTSVSKPHRNRLKKRPTSSTNGDPHEDQ